MTNTKLLRDIIRLRGFKIGALAMQLGLTGYGFQRKVDGKSEFKAREVAILSKSLQLTAKEQSNIFFNEEVI